MDLSDARVAQILIPVSDYRQGRDFYRDALGLPLMFEAPPQMAFFSCGDLRLLVGEVPPGESAKRGSQIYFKVADIHAVHATLNSRGARFRAEPHVVHRTPQYVMWLAEFTDPDGNQLALMSEVPVTA